ncbi:MaoC family dehydratase N-terminal domain-containing protein [Mesorhizobium sp. BR1-1-9]|uniref:FAS1-like dehydratase domain-containing protein n=1 Tax=Mesorhizobium sp. BR1-1-9 TaxID=2876646 RepID=UPI001CD0693C|nr:MaoC family dehydratase N-terminal domain-containing protein [Mesorhizobium sp. BR1-1-9]MBZ9870420.1 MaoC family dehydratase N-terminal domain-containing protein [Mesorhizobium sp. BR1-1-9]
MAEPIHYDALSVGDEIPHLVKGPMTTAHIMRWSAAMENWHKIHYDWRYATKHDNLPDVLVNGSWKQHVLAQLLVDWVGEDGWLWKMNFQYRGMNVPGDTLTAWGRVTGKREQGAYGVVELEIGLKDQNGKDGSPGTAVVVLPRRNGPKVPYPFCPAILE